MLPRVGYLGPEGTFSEEALLSNTLPDSVAPVPQATIYDTVVALRDGDLEGAVIPIENSLDGSISVTLDLLADEAGEVRIVGETLLTVRHSLIAARAVELSEIETVLTHPKVPGQCARFLHGALTRARVLPASSTAEAVREVVGDAEPGRAALGTRLAADIYGGTVLREDVQDRDDNETRFVWLGRAGERAPTPLHEGGAGEGADGSGDSERVWKTSLVFWGPGADSPGWLVRCLDEFARREINLTKIESRPRRERLGHYMFFVDLEGGVEAERSVSEAVSGVREMCEEVRVLGSYPRAP
ncbi:MAG TPA: prephenate dehydratase [Solirubrobacteraceae bacterium]